jgi:hypothetical protein
VELIVKGRLLFRESMWLWNLDGGELREEAGTKGFGAWVPESWVVFVVSRLLIGGRKSRLTIFTG